MDILLTIDEVASYLKISKETVYKMAQRGDIPAIKVGTQWRFESSAVDVWLRSHSNQKTAKHTPRAKKSNETSHD